MPLKVQIRVQARQLYKSRSRRPHWQSFYRQALLQTHLDLMSLTSSLKSSMWIPLSLKTRYEGRRCQHIVLGRARVTHSSSQMDNLPTADTRLLYMVISSCHGTILYTMVGWPCSHEVAPDFLKKMISIPAACVRIYSKTRR